jgi:glycosyltransferase involved in cell wall biosynthesis
MTAIDSRGRKFPSLSVFFPAYNDAPSLPSLLAKAFATLEENVEDFEVIVVNDGSRDDTAGVLQALQIRYGQRLRVITHAVNRGYGGALRTGFEAAGMEYVFYTDGDGQYDVRELPLLLARVGPNTGLVNGYKLRRRDPWRRILIGRVYNAVARALFGIRIRDIDCDFRLIRRDLLCDLNLTSTSGTICVELVKKVELTGCEAVEIAVHHYPRLHGKSQFFRVRSLLTTFGQFARIYVRLVAVPAAAGVRRRNASALARLILSLQRTE